MTASTIRLVIADQQEIFRRGLQSVLAVIGWTLVVGETDDEETLFEILSSDHVDIVLLDLEMSDGPGQDVLKRLRGEFGQVSVVVLVAVAGHGFLLRRAIELDVHGMISRNAGPAELESALRAVAGGHRYIQPDLMGSLVAISTSSRERIADQISPRQFEILGMVSRGKTNRQIAHELQISETTVKSELRVVYAELGVSSRAEAVAAALRSGLVD